MNYLSVCSGIEAATCAWHPLGWNPIAFSEIEPFPSAVLAYHYPDVPNLGDMTKFKEWKIEPGSVDILVGGTPCQSFSVAGLRRGLDDPRGNLMLTFGAIADYYKPRWLVWENVPGVLSSGGGRDFGTFLGMLGLIGYGFAYRILDAQFFRVAQRRRRVFVVGYLGDWRRAAAVLFESEGLRWDSPPSREARKVAPTISSSGAGTSRTGNSRTESDFLVTSSHWDGDFPHPTLNQSAKGSGGVGASNQELFSQRGAYLVPGNPVVMAHGQGNAEVVRDGSPSLTCNHEAPILAFDCKRNGASSKDVAPTLRSMNYDKSHANAGGQLAIAVRTANTGANGQVAHTLDRAQGQAIGIQAGALKENPSIGPDGVGIRDDGLSYTLEARAEVQAVAFAQNTRDEVRLQGGDGQIVGALAAEPGMKQTSYIKNGMAVRRLTPRECERLQGFPEERKTFILSPCVEEKKGLAPSVAQSSQAPNQGAKERALVNVLIDFDLQRLQLHKAGKLLLSASFADAKNSFLRHTQGEDFARLIALMKQEGDKIITTGKAESPRVNVLSSHQPNGSIFANLYGLETEELASGAGTFMSGAIEHLKSITSQAGKSSLNLEQKFITLSFFVASAINGFIQEKTQTENISPIRVETVCGWTMIPWRGATAENCPDGPRYKACGNSMAVPVMHWIGRRIEKTETILKEELC